MTDQKNKELTEMFGSYLDEKADQEGEGGAL